MGKNLRQIDSDNGHLSIARVKLSELSTASALKPLYQMGSIYSPYSISKKKGKEIKRKLRKRGKGEEKGEILSSNYKNMVRISFLNGKYRFHTLL